MSEFTLQKIQKNERGIYCWNSPIGLDYYRANLMNGVRVCAAVAVGIVAVGAGILAWSGNWGALPRVLLGALGFSAVCALIFTPLFLLGKNPMEHYELCKDWVRTGTDRNATLFLFNRTKRMIVHRDCLELRGNLMKMRIYVPEEDFPLIRDYILTLLPDDALVSIQ